MIIQFLALLLFPILAFSAPFAQSRFDDQVITRTHYSLSYNEQHEVANWVAYPLGHAQIKNCVARADAFRADPLVTTGSATLEDYRGSNFDRGHLLPAGDMRFNREAMRDTFYLSNMTPQPANFNRGRWKSLENLVRAWALKYNDLLVVTGPILENNLPTIGNQNRVSVPVEYYKVILKKKENSYEGIGFLVSVNVPYSDLSLYALTINQIEARSGIDFFPFLNDSQEEQIEEAMNVNAWDFKAKFEYLPCSI
jgi:endonuclease G